MSARPLVSLLAHRLAVPAPTGIARYVVELASALHALAEEEGDGPRYEVAAPAEDAAPDWLPPGLERRVLRGPRQALTIAWNLFGRPRVDASLGRPDIVHALYPWSATPTRAPFVATIHDVMPLTNPDWYSRKDRWVNGRGTRDAIDHAAHLCVVSGFVARQLIELGARPERTTVVHNGVGEEFFAAAGVPDSAVAEVCARHGVTLGRYLVAVGSVSDRKNVVVLLRALARVAPDANAGGAELLVAGPDGQGAEAIRAEAAAARLGGRVRFGGFVPAADLPALVAGARALVHPSRDEGFGLTPLEAMAAGTPAIASNRASLPEVVGDAGVLVDADDPDAWAAAIARVRDDDEHHDALAARGRRHAEAFHWARAAQQVRAVHLGVLDRS